MWYENATTTTTMVTILDDEEEEEENDEGYKGLVQVFRVFKLARILKLARLNKKSLRKCKHAIFQTLPGSAVHRVHPEPECAGAGAAGDDPHHLRPHLRQPHLLHRDGEQGNVATLL